MALARSPQPEPVSGGPLAWWLGELRELLPRRWRERGPRRPSLVLQLERPFVRVYERRGRRLESLGSLVLPEATGPADAMSGDAAVPRVEERLRRALDRHKGATVLLLGEQDALTCVDLLPASAEGELTRIMAHKLDLLTPWSAEQGFAAQKVVGRRRDGTLEVLLAAAPKAELDRLLLQLAALGVTPASVDVAPDQDPLRAAGVDLLRGGTPERLGQALLIFLLALSLAGVAAGVGWAGWEIYQRQERVAVQDRLVAELGQRLADVPELRRRLEAMQAQARFLADDRRSRPSPLLVLEALSRLLPDTVWLTEITLEDRELAVAGMAEDASTLIPLVEGAPEFEQVRFQAPSTRVTARSVDGGEREVERFALRAVVVPTAEPSL
ncbi:MAG TPA: PilN domain-containing protein [Geminicoccaceae bacterium]|nr:PilN domain-containing protein [Geminicoccaceae bacterium]